MLAPRNRLVLGRGKWRERKEAYGPYFKMIYRTNQSLLPARIGFITTSVIGKAAVRNRARRLLAEAVRARLDKLPAGFEAIFIANPKILNTKYEEVLASVDKVLSKLSFPK